MITLNDESLKALESYLLEVPFKYANPILVLLGKLNAEQNPPIEEAKEV